MTIHIKELVPANATHPGEVLKEELEANAIKQKDFALQTGIPRTQLNEIIKGKRGINADIALRIGKALQMDADLWMNLQSGFDLAIARIKEKNRAQLEAMDRWDMIKNYIPLKFYKKHSVISGNPLKDIETVFTIYGAKNSDELISVYSKTSYACFRKSEKLEIDKINLIGWVKLVNYKATQLSVAAFDCSSKEQLLAELKQIFRANKNTVELTQLTLGRHGIKLVAQQKPDKCAIDGISFWSNGNPAVGISLRHLRIDNFAFTIMHELGHIFLHLVNNNTAEFIDLEDSDNGYGNSKEEIEANQFSADALIDKHAWQDFTAKSTIHNTKHVYDFAKKVGVHPALIYGRYSKETGNYKIKTSIDRALQ
ncbi:HigA family addiction module antitoxin [Solitalea lacus]|uniref:HigA family addiction module antitoxin n=1 Tax=Solitalea lacus TaxID=2911172 RepID=UPI001EDBF341|nr:HigA family addiction module antitoxin [Solitalea lacus]UKJ07936.1 HigA family addiction module antitoxin [Solitalea lacus]